MNESASSLSVSSHERNTVEQLESAAEHFILNKDFETVFDICDRALQDLSNSEHEDDRSADVKSGFCILGIQALAELNEWRRVLPWVLQQYENQEKIPAKIMQLCVLLYSKVGEEAVMLDVTHVWLHCETNISSSGFTTVFELFLLHVLIPLGCLQEARELVCGRVGSSTLTEEQKYTALEIIEDKSQKNDPSSPSSPSSSSTACLQTKPQGSILHKLGAIIKYLHKKLLGPLSSSLHLHKLFLFAVLLYMICVRLDPALPSSFMWISKLHQLMRPMWAALFGPYYLTTKK